MSNGCAKKSTNENYERRRFIFALTEEASTTFTFTVRFLTESENDYGCGTFRAGSEHPAMKWALNMRHWSQSIE